MLWIGENWHVKKYASVKNWKWKQSNQKKHHHLCNIYFHICYLHLEYWTRCKKSNENTAWCTWFAWSRSVSLPCWVSQKMIQARNSANVLLLNNHTKTNLLLPYFPKTAEVMFWYSKLCFAFETDHYRDYWVTSLQFLQAVSPITPVVPTVFGRFPLFLLILLIGLG